MSRGPLVRLVLVLGILAGCVAVALNIEPRLGLDLRGGTQILLQAEDSERAEANAENVDRAVEVLRGRVNNLGVAETTLVRQGEDRILVELPDVQDPSEALDVLQQTAQLEVRPVIRQVQPQGGEGEEQQLPEPQQENHTVIEDESGVPLELGPVALAGDEITRARAEMPEQQTDWVVNVSFTNQGSQAFGDLSAEAACAQGAANRIAIVLDDEVISSPTVNVPCGGNITGSTSIYGDFSFEEAEELAVLIEGGALPLPVEVIQTSTVGPTLGDEAIEASAEAGVIGLVLTGLFIILVYRLVGFLATVALASYALISYAALLALGATLTLPGLAGFVLAIGLAIDANVLVFERAREEYDEYPGGGLKRALMRGFNKAWSAILDSQVTTLLAAGLLFALAAGPVRGFGVTLTIGVVASLISALIVARVLTEVAVVTPPVAKRPRFAGLGYIGKVREWLVRRNPQIIVRRGLWVAVSGLLLVLAGVGIGVKGLNLGVEFTGGRTVEYVTSQPVDIDEARQQVADAGFPEAVVQEGDRNKVVVRTGEITDEEQSDIQSSLGEIGGEVDKEVDEEVGPALGEELRNKALLAFGIALLVQMLYLAIRFFWTYAISAVLPMFVDVTLVVGFFAWTGKPIDGVFLAAALTIIGLSVNDTVVIFDRIREHWRGSRDESFVQVSNKAILDTIPRTVNTGLGAMFILAALAILGGDSLEDFSIALLLGLTIGMFSTIFLATPMLSYLNDKWPMSRAEKIKQERDPQDSGAVV